MPLVKAILEALFWLVIASLTIVLTMLVFGWSMTPTLSYVAVVGLIVLMPLVLRMIVTVRRRRGAAVISYLAQAVRLNLPLPRMLQAAQENERGKLAEQLGHLSAQLESGQGLGTALAAAAPEVGAGPLAMLQAAERIGRVPHALLRLTRENGRGSSGDPTDAAFFRAYPFMMVLVLATILSMIGVFVMPKFETIFRDFGIKLPAITVFTISIFGQLGPAAIVVTIIVTVCWMGMALWRIIDPKTAACVPAVRDRIFWSLPLMHSLLRDRGLAEALDLIAEALSASQPIERAVGEATRLRVNEVLRRRLERWADRLRAGLSLHDAAREARMPGLVVEMLAPVRGADQAAEVISFLSRYYDARFSRARVLLRAASAPLMVFFFAAIVACVALSLLTPMITMINNLSSGTSGGWR